MVALTVMALELKARDESAFSAFWPPWPTGISYAVRFLFTAIIWIKYRYLMRFVGTPTRKLVWINFVRPFMISLLPLRRHGLLTKGIRRMHPACFRDYKA